jgi:hypothetical protein
MSVNNTEQLTLILSNLKVGSILTKRKSNGEKYSRHFYLDEQEDFISYYQSEKIFAQPRRCKFFRKIFFKNLFNKNIDYIRDIDEIRIGLHTLTFDGLLRKKILDDNDVGSTVMKIYCLNSIFRKNLLFLSSIIIIEINFI